MCGGDEDTAMAMIRNEIRREQDAHWKTHDCLLTEAAIAERMGISPQYLSDLTCGRRRVSANVAARMHVYCGWPGDEIYQRQAVMDFEAAWRGTPLKFGSAIIPAQRKVP